MRAKRNGSALITVMGVVLLISMLSVYMLSNARQQIFSTILIIEQIKAQCIAESGVNDAYNVLKQDFHSRNDISKFPIKQFDNGTYHATVTSVNSNVANILSIGRYGRAKATSQAAIRNIVHNGYYTNKFNANPYSYSFLSGGDFYWVGNSDVDMGNGWGHCNGNFSINGANTIKGNISAHNNLQMIGGAKINGMSLSKSPLVKFPLIDMTPYYNKAKENGEVYGTKNISGNVKPNGGIMWVNGDLTIGNGTYVGCFIATGTIELKTTGNNDITIIKANGYPILMSRDGDINIKEVKMFNFNGLIFSQMGIVNKSGNGDVNGVGSVMANGGIIKNGGWSGMIYSDSTPVSPNGFIDSCNIPVIESWHE